MEFTKELTDRTNKIQLELQSITETAYKYRKNDKLTYQDCMNVAIFTKLAELELKIEGLENRPLPKIDSCY